MSTSKRLVIIGMLAMLALLLFPTSTTKASWVSLWQGRWRSYDIPGDGSTNTVTFNYQRLNQYTLTWYETYFSLCGNGNGVGRGTGEEFSTPDSLDAKMRVSIDFYCASRFAQHFDLIFTFDCKTDTFNGAGVTWRRIARPYVCGLGS